MHVSSSASLQQNTQIYFVQPIGTTRIVIISGENILIMQHLQSDPIHGHTYITALNVRIHTIWQSHS